METAVKNIRPSGLSSMTYFDGLKSVSTDFRSPHPVTNSSAGVPASPHLYPGPPPPYSYPASSVASMPSLNGLASPPDSRRTSGDEKDSKPVLLKHSLPSIHEALGPPPPLSYPPPPPPPPAPISTSHATPTSPRLHSSGPSPTVGIPRSHAADPTVLDGNGASTAQPALHPPYPSQPLSTPSYHAAPPAEARRTSGPLPFASDRLPSMMSVGSPEQRLRGDRYAATYEHTSPRSSHDASRHPLTANVSPAYSHHASRPSYPSASSHAAHPLNHPPTHYHSQAAAYSSRYDAHAEVAREAPTDSYKSYASASGEHYGTSVKRHLDYFDLENSLTELVDSSSRVRDFGRDFKDRARELPRAGPAPGVLPSIAECDAMISHQARVQELLLRLRDMLLSQQNALASQPGAEPRCKGHGEYDIDTGVIYEDGKGDAFMGPDAKKRRGRAAPPGRCHSCNRAETPEWRRGPDGARTLCNACGLHYAKLTRKMGSKNVPPAPSSLQPKSLGPGSPR